jgi:hypothetical protein
MIMLNCAPGSESLSSNWLSWNKDPPAFVTPCRLISFCLFVHVFVSGLWDDMVSLVMLLIMICLVELKANPSTRFFPIQFLGHD